MKTVMVVGNSSDTNRLYELVKKVVKEKGINAETKKDESSSSNSKYGLKKSTGIVIEGKLRVEGMISEYELEKELKRYL